MGSSPPSTETTESFLEANPATRGHFPFLPSWREPRHPPGAVTGKSSRNGRMKFSMEKYEENQDYDISHEKSSFSNMGHIFGTYGKIKIFHIGKSGGNPVVYLTVTAGSSWDFLSFSQVTMESHPLQIRGWSHRIFLQVQCGAPVATKSLSLSW